MNFGVSFPLTLMPASSADQSGRKATFDFYNGFLAVVYGLLVSKGLENLLIFTKEENRDSIGFPLFLGGFVLALHFWYVCATVDDLAQDFYQVCVKRRTPLFNLLVLIDLFVATGFALCVLAMFNAIPNQDTSHPDPQFFVWFLMAGGLSLLYDVYSRLLVWRARHWGQKDCDDTINNYLARINGWLKQDILFVSFSGLICYWRNAAVSSLITGLAFALFTVILLFVLDVGFFQKTSHPMLK